MKLQRTFICIASVFFAVGFAASQAAAGGEVNGCGDQPDGNGNGFLEIEVNQLRAGARVTKTSPNGTTKVTAKARILKGTADGDTTMITTLRIQAVDGEVVMGDESQGNITLGVGKGGKGATLTVATTQCDSGLVDFIATFTGQDEEGDTCVGERTLTKACQ